MRSKVTKRHVKPLQHKFKKAKTNKQLLSKFQTCEKHVDNKRSVTQFTGADFPAYIEVT